VTTLADAVGELVPPHAQRPTQIASAAGSRAARIATDWPVIARRP